MTQTKVGRRGFIAGAGAGALAGTLPQPAQAAKRKKTKRVDVCVIGAGLAGLTAARELRKRGLRVHVVEADDRVGGRVWTVKAKSGITANFGATFIGPGQDKIVALARELGVKSHPTYNSGQNVLYFDGRRQTYTGTVPPVDVTALAEAALLTEQVNGMAQQLEPGAPWKHPRAREWDGQTFNTWKLANATTPGARKLLDLAVEGLFSVESPEISFLYVLSYIKAAGNLNLLVDTAGGAQERQFTGGSQQIPEKMAAQLGKGAVTLRSPARFVRTKGSRTTVISDRIDVTCRRVVVAVPPTMVNRIFFEPGLAAMKDQLYQRMPFGSIGKGIAVYDEPWWRKKGLTGQATSDTGPMKVTFDLTPPSGTPGVLMGFVDARDAREFSTWSKAQRRARCIDQFAFYFGEEARNPKEFLDVLFDEEIWHRGCPVCFTPPGVLTSYGELINARDGARYFASTETATVWTGYMDGAVQAGQEVAAAIAKELS
jgi:monoamine oxidase